MQIPAGARGLKGDWEWLEFAANLPSNPQFVINQSASGLVFGGPCILTGASFSHSGTAAGTIQLLDGLDATGGAVNAFSIAAGSNGQASLPSKGVLMELGVYLKLTTAIVTGSVYVVPLWHYRGTPPGE